MASPDHTTHHADCGCQAADPVRTLIEEARTLMRDRIWVTSDHLSPLVAALEASEARGARLSEGIQALIDEKLTEGRYWASVGAETQAAYCEGDADSLRSLLASCDKDTQDG